jgi:hypothetical protein
MKFRRQLQIGDVVGLLGLHYGLPLLGIVRAIDGDVIACHHTTGLFPNTRPHEVLWVPRRATFDVRTWAGWIKFFWGMVR